MLPMLLVGRKTCFGFHFRLSTNIIIIIITWACLGSSPGWLLTKNMVSQTPRTPFTAPEEINIILYNKSDVATQQFFFCQNNSLGGKHLVCTISDLQHTGKGGGMLRLVFPCVKLIFQLFIKMSECVRRSVSNLGLTLKSSQEPLFNLRMTSARPEWVLCFYSCPFLTVWHVYWTSTTRLRCRNFLNFDF